MKGKGLRDLLREYERMIIMRTLAANGNDKAKTASALRMTRRALDKALERHRLVKRRYARPLPIGRTDDDREA